MSQDVNKTLDEVKRIIADRLGVDEDKVTLKAHFINDLGADSLDTVELVMALEDKFDIRIPDEEAEKISNLDEVVNFINKILNEKKLASS